MCSYNDIAKDIVNRAKVNWLMEHCLDFGATAKTDKDCHWRITFKPWKNCSAITASVDIANDFGVRLCRFKTTFRKSDKDYWFNVSCIERTIHYCRELHIHNDYCAQSALDLYHDRIGSELKNLGLLFEMGK